MEVSDLSGEKEAIEAGADVVILDKMDIDRIKETIEFIDGKAVVEVSGGLPEVILFCWQMPASI